MIYEGLFVSLDEFLQILCIKAVWWIEKKRGYELETVLNSTFCYDLRIKELPTLSHQPVSMTRCRGQRYTEYTR